MGNFAMDVKSAQKKFNVTVEGMFTSQNAMDFIAEFQKNTASFNPKEFELIFDATKLKVSPQEMLPLLEKCITMYKQLGFKTIKFSLGSSTIVKTQVKRVIDKVGLDNCEII